MARRKMQAAAALHSGFRDLTENVCSEKSRKMVKMNKK